MRQIKTFSDNRLDLMCSYCGRYPDTRDHVPSKILLEEPYPENLPVVPCCNECNQGFSSDEVYVACLLECAICGTTDVDKLKREKIKRVLYKKQSLQQEISQSMVEIGGRIFFNYEIDRFKNVFLKLAKGHAKFENSEPVLDEPTHWAIKPLPTMSEDEIDLFLKDSKLNKSFEVGSRAMQNLLMDTYNSTYSHWIIVQPDNYQYTVAVNPLTVKIIIWNYLAIEVTWNE